MSCGAIMERNPVNLFLEVESHPILESLLTFIPGILIKLYMHTSYYALKNTEKIYCICMVDYTINIKCLYYK